MIKGETLKLEVTNPDTTAVEFRFGGPQTHNIAATKNGDTFTASTSTAEWTSGAYRWQTWATFADGSVSVISQGSLDLYDALGVGDVRLPARKVVEMIKAQMAGNAGEGVKRYKINNRELERYSSGELLQLLSWWTAEMKKEEKAGNGCNSLGPRISVRF
jgi:hypothetical protein